MTEKLLFDKQKIKRDFRKQHPTLLFDYFVGAKIGIKFAVAECQKRQEKIDSARIDKIATIISNNGTSKQWAYKVTKEVFGEVKK